MSIIRKLTIAMGILFGLFMLIGLMLPGEMHVQRTAEIDTPPEQVFPLVNDLKAFNRWAPWTGQEHQVQFNYSGPDSGVGARMTWKNDAEGSQIGSQEIIESTPPRQVVFSIDFGPQGAATATVELEPSATGSRVAWRFDYEIGYDLVGRYIGAMMEGPMGNRYAMGLARLKELVETGGIAAPVGH